ncbi:MAG TPA: inositol-3-phosphate synthase, partial [Thermoanaerobaculia bacterium]|nr:inositol-3-phosphate synthase [Thermoanaerobaculia bacterium]
MRKPEVLQPAHGKLAILLPGLGAVSTTMIAGALLARKGLGEPIGSLTQMGTIRLGMRTEAQFPRIADFLGLASLDDLAFGAWDIFPDNAYESAVHANVLTREHLDLVRGEMEQIVPMPGVFYPEYVRKLHGTHVKTGANKAEMVEQLRDDIRT